MAYAQKDATQYLDPLTGEYYTKQVYQPMYNNGYMSMGGFVPYGHMGTPYMYGNPMMNMPREIRRNTGDVSQVWKMMQNRQPYQYNVPTLESLFPTMAMPAINNFQQNQSVGGLLNDELIGSSGAARFLGNNPLNNVTTPQNNIMQPVVNSTINNMQNPIKNMSLDQYLEYAKTAPRYTPQRMSVNQANAMGLPLFGGKAPMMNAFGQPMMMGGFNFADNSLKAQKDAVMAQAAAQKSGT